MIERARAIHRHEAGAEDGERHDLPRASIFDDDHEEDHQSGDRQNGSKQMSQAVYRLAKGDAKFHFSKLHNRSTSESGGVANLATVRTRPGFCGRQGSAVGDDLIAFAEASDWQQALINYGRLYAAQVERDLKVFVRTQKEQQ